MNSVLSSFLAFALLAGATGGAELIGDGQADDTEALQRLADRGGLVQLPRGVYRLTRPVVADLDRVGWFSITGGGVATLRMSGPGPALHVLGTHRGTADPNSVEPDVWSRQRMPCIDGLEIVGDHAEAIGVRIEGTMQAILTRVAVRSALHGVHLLGRNRNVIVSECHLYDNRGVGLFLDRLNLHQVNVTNCHISYNAGGGIVVRGSEVRNFQIGACDIEANMAPDAPPTANILLDTMDGSVREGAIVGCTLQHSPKAQGGANIRLLGRSQREPHKVGFFSIADNQISDTEVNIHLRHARGVSISGNTFFGGYRHDVLAEDCSNLVLGANLFDRNPDYPKGCRDGLLLAECTDCTLTGLQINNTFQTEAALVLRKCGRINVTGCTILDSDGCGLLIDDCRQVRVSGCLVRDDRPDAQSPVAIRVAGGEGIQIGENLLRGVSEGLPRP